MVYKFITISCVCVFYQLHTIIIPLKLAYSLLCASMDKQLETLIYIYIYIFESWIQVTPSVILSNVTPFNNLL